MSKIIQKLKKVIKQIPKKVKYIIQLYLATEMPLYSANAAFFMIITCIPLFMLLFSCLSFMSDIKVDDLIYNINLLFPNLPYITDIVKNIMNIADDLAAKNAVSINVVIAFITGSTALYSFTIGIRRIHNITHSSGFLRLRFVALANMFIFFAAIIIMLIAFLLGSMILGYIATYLPFAEDVIEDVMSFRYMVAIIVLFILMMSVYSTSTNFERKFRHNVLGAIISTILWLIISNCFSFYFRTFPLNASVYGSLTGVVLVLMWVLICMNLIFLGSVINEVYYPQKRILEEQKQMIMKQLSAGDDKDVDRILAERYKLRKVHKYDRPDLDVDDDLQ